METMWILILSVLVSGEHGGPAVEAINFSNKEACQEALGEVILAYEEQKFLLGKLTKPKVFGVCVPDR